MSLARKIGALFGAGSSIDPALGGLPPGAYTPYAGTTAPAGWLMCDGSAISRTTYAALFAAIGTLYGAGDGSTTFNLPDVRGRVPAGKDDMGGSAASRLNVTLTGTRGSTANGNITGLSSTAGLAVGMKAFGTGIGTNAVIQAITSATAVTLSVNNTATGTGSIRFGVVDGATLGAVGGSHVHTLDVGQMPAHSHTVQGATTSAPAFQGSDSGATMTYPSSQATNSQGSGYAHPNLQPTLVANYIIKT